MMTRRRSFHSALFTSIDLRECDKISELEILLMKY